MLLRIDFGKKDADLKRWKISVQMAGYSVKTLISQMILADLQNMIIILPLMNDTVSVSQSSMSLKFEIKDVVVENHLNSMPMYSRSAYIKALIRKNILLNGRSNRRKQAEKCPLSSDVVAEKSPFSGEKSHRNNSKMHEKSGLSAHNRSESVKNSEVAENCPPYVSDDTEFCPRNTTEKVPKTDENSDKSRYSGESREVSSGNAAVAEKCPFSEISENEMGRKSAGEHNEDNQHLIEYDDVFELDDNEPDMGMLSALAGE